MDNHAPITVELGASTVFIVENSIFEKYLFPRQTFVFKKMYDCKNKAVLILWVINIKRVKSELTAYCAYRNKTVLGSLCHSIYLKTCSLNQTVKEVINFVKFFEKMLSKSDIDLY